MQFLEEMKFEMAYSIKSQSDSTITVPFLLTCRGWRGWRLSFSTPATQPHRTEALPQLQKAAARDSVPPEVEGT